MDPLAEILDALRLQTGLISRAQLSAPFALHTSGTPYAIFHAVTEGDAWLMVHQRDPVLLHTGDLVLLPHGDPHVMCDRPGRHTRPVASLPVVHQGGGLARMIHGGGGRSTHLLCGKFTLGNTAALDALAGRLPAAMIVRADQGGIAAWLDANVSLLGTELSAGEPGTSAIVTRVTDLMFARALRAWASSAEAAVGSWVGGLRDPGLAAALAAVHSEPAAAWTTASMARRAGMSRTVFHERFRALVGDTPSRYLAAWRMQAAADLLDTDPGQSVAEVGVRVGYRSEDAFTKAFRRELGMTPAGWRRRRAAG